MTLVERLNGTYRLDGKFVSLAPWSTVIHVSRWIGTHSISRTHFADETGEGDGITSEF